MFKEERNSAQFNWSMIGDIEKGRPNLGNNMEVAVYRLMQFTMRDIMIKNLGVEAAEKIIYEAGELAGKEFCLKFVTKGNDLSDFLREVQEIMEKLNIGIVRIEHYDPQKQMITLTVAEDLDCSGLPPCGETICTYDEGFLSGLVSQHTGISFIARETDCWCNGDRVCRFEVKPAL
ncbi:V4R domain-containing protein [Dethiosulfatarculus sandiegensis]|uniref:4-vinyl reductase 4VR n=1 Tax=Dethiosulfatarculus sandiegensis TaxID=1429043 RepID=A0A0D2K0S1_9BACT|nr:V4R domain-containing protein [Dethiosulfatarculus sandiegensis]KIX15325.1 4-vinyl reductase 4VR [Dethiosulfatarculus sandiegensis]